MGTDSGTIARLIVTLAVLAIAGVILVVEASPANSAIAATIIGAVVGYWLHVAEHDGSSN